MVMGDEIETVTYSLICIKHFLIRKCIQVQLLKDFSINLQIKILSEDPMRKKHFKMTPSCFLFAVFFVVYRNSISIFFGVIYDCSKDLVKLC